MLNTWLALRISVTSSPGMEEARKYLFVVASMAGRRFQWLKGRHQYHVHVYVGMGIVLLVHLQLTDMVPQGRWYKSGHDDLHNH